MSWSWEVQIYRCRTCRLYSQPVAQKMSWLPNLIHPHLALLIPELHSCAWFICRAESAAFWEACSLAQRAQYNSRRLIHCLSLQPPETLGTVRRNLSGRHMWVKALRRLWENQKITKNEPEKNREEASKSGHPHIESPRISLYPMLLTGRWKDCTGCALPTLRVHIFLDCWLGEDDSHLNNALEIQAYDAMVTRMCKPTVARVI